MLYQSNSLLSQLRSANIVRATIQPMLMVIDSSNPYFLS